MSSIGVVSFPGSNCDVDTLNALEDLRVSVERIWYEETDLSRVDRVILPGGFSYGDYLRSGALAAKAPVMKAIRSHVCERQLPILGICNGFQILTESGLLPGVLRQNRHGEFRSGWQRVRVVEESPWFPTLQSGETLRLPIAHGEGAFYVAPGTLGALFEDRQVWLQYVDFEGALSPLVNPNGSVANIAGVIRGSIAGLMPHPERAMAEYLGSVDGKRLLTAWIASDDVPVGRE